MGEFYCVLFFKQKTAYEMRISDWSSDVCSSDLGAASGVRCPSICRGAGGDASSSAMPFLKLLMPLATSPIISEKRPLPNSNRTITPKTSQCQMLKPPIENLLAPPI